MSKPYRRRRGVIWRPGQLGVPDEPPSGRGPFGWLWAKSWVNDGGEDAPLSPRGRFIFRMVVLGIIVWFLAAILITLIKR